MLGPSWRLVEGWMVVRRFVSFFTLFHIECIQLFIIVERIGYPPLPSFSLFLLRSQLIQTSSKLRSNPLPKKTKTPQKNLKNKGKREEERGKRLWNPLFHINKPIHNHSSKEKSLKSYMISKKKHAFLTLFKEDKKVLSFMQMNHYLCLKVIAKKEKSLRERERESIISTTTT